MVANLNILALDVGERRVGLALAGSASGLSSPFKTLINSDKIIEEIQKIIKDQTVGVLVIGLPINLKNQETDQTRYVREFARKIESLVDVPIYFENEALSSVRAKQVLENQKKSYKKEEIDSLAACYILDDFIANHPEVIGA